MSLCYGGLGGFPPDVKWHGDLLAAYAAAFERGAVYTPHAVSYVRQSPKSYGAPGSQQRAAWRLAGLVGMTRQPGWERRRAALVAGAIWPDYRLRAVRALVEDRSLRHASAGTAARLVIDLDQTGAGFRHWLSPLGPCGQNAVPRWLLHTQ